MQVVLVIGRCINVDDKTDVINVNATSGHVCCYQSSGHTIFKCLECSGADGLSFTAMKCTDGNALEGKFFCKCFGSGLSAHEKDGAPITSGDLCRDFVLVQWMHHENVVIHGAHCGLCWRSCMFNGIAKVVPH